MRQQLIKAFSRRAESEGPVIDGAVVNVPLLAACLQLGKAFDLNSPTTVLQIFLTLAGGQPHLSRQIGSIFQCYRCRGALVSERHDSLENPMQPSRSSQSAETSRTIRAAVA